MIALRPQSTVGGVPVHDAECLHRNVFVSFIPFSSIVQCSGYRSFASLAKFIPKHFWMLFYAIVFLIYFSDRSLLVHRNAIGFHVLTLFPAALLNLFSQSVCDGV